MSTSLKTNWIFYLRSSSKFWNFWKFEKGVFVVHLIYVYSRFDQHAAQIVVVLSRFDAVKAGFVAVGFDVGLCGQIPGRIHFQKYAKIWYAKIRSWNPKSNKKLLGFLINRESGSTGQYGRIEWYKATWMGNKGRATLITVFWIIWNHCLSKTYFWRLVLILALESEVIDSLEFLFEPRIWHFWLKTWSIYISSKGLIKSVF